MPTLTPTTRALTSLLPTSYPVPPRLASTTDSLLSLSRQRAPNLKPDEEIARAHACAEIACKRLRVALRLPNIKSGNGAPCRPGVYRKLLVFLEARLEGDVGTPGRATPGTGRKRSLGELMAHGERGGEAETPTKKKRTADAPAPTTPARGSAKKSNAFLGRIQESARKKGQDTEEAPEYVLPAVRKLCKAFKTPKMVPHVYTGVCVVRRLAEELPRTDMIERDEAGEHRQNVLALMLAIYLLTLTRMQQGEMTTEIYEAVSRSSVRILGLDEVRDALYARVEQWIARINDSDWTSAGKGSDWWSTVPEEVISPPKLTLIEAAGQLADTISNGGDLGDEKPRSKHSKQTRDVESWRDDLRKQLEEGDPEDVLLPGLGTMMNEAVDYYSEERKAAYEQWKADILRQMDAIEKGGMRKGKAMAAAA